jgi:hypothetical protein
MQPGEKMDDVNEQKIEERNKPTEQQHRHDDQDCIIDQLPIPAETSLLRVPWPRGFLELDFDFVKKGFRFS